MARRILQDVLTTANLIYSDEGETQSRKGDSGIIVDLALQTPNVADVTGFLYSATGAAGTKLTPTAAVISGDDIVLTLTGVPSQAPVVWYQYGGPGAAAPLGGDTDAQRRTKAGIDNPVYDNRVPGVNTTLGFPVGFAGPLS